MRESIHALRCDVLCLQGTHILSRQSWVSLEWEVGKRKRRKRRREGGRQLCVGGAAATRAAGLRST
ncbi:hypothetical protein GBAR_LOCUS25079 [Geodia barretti]|uniref:Uncharacterized protein n=1 Tax=Geodia barretti TaxID=519541 RepID=A0AA35X4Q8_GEOBA|nr:hypothetical protein GBAR_LOCUS25079 [Geodia barretti]